MREYLHSDSRVCVCAHVCVLAFVVAVSCSGCWDVAAGALLVTEAGGVVTDTYHFHGDTEAYDLMSRRVLATATPELAKRLVELLEATPRSAHEP